MKKAGKILLLTLVVIVGIMGAINIIPEVLPKSDVSDNMQAYNHNFSNVLDNIFEQNEETILPFIFDNSDQTLTKVYLLEQFAKKGITVENKGDLKDIIVTGDQIKTSEKTYTVLIYGDVNQDGYVDVFDADRVFRHFIYEGQYKLTGLFEVAGNVYNADKEVDTFDAQRIFEFYFGLETKLVFNEPESTKEADAKSPKISLVGENPQIVRLQEEYEELGATAKDYKGNEIETVEIDASKVDTGTIGEYEVTYTAVDKDGYKGTAIRKVQVVDYVVDITATTSEKDYQEYGEEIDTSLITVTATMKSGETKEIEASDYTVTGYDSSKLDQKQTITIVYTTKDTVDGEEKTFEDTCEVTAIIKIKGINISENRQVEHYRYDSNILTSAVATISSSNTTPLTDNSDDSGDCILSYELETPSGEEDGSEVSIRTVGNGDFMINLYATQAGTYKITPIATGHKVRKTVKGDPIVIEIKENLAVTDIKINDVLVTDANTAITVKEEKTKQEPIKFYHKYYDKNNMDNHDVYVEITDLTQTDLTVTATGNRVGEVLLRDVNGAVVTYNEDNGELQQHPTSICVTGARRGSATLIVSLTNNPKYCTQGESNLFTKTINVTVEEKARTTGINISSNMNLFTYQPQTNRTITSIDGSKEYKYYANGTTLVANEKISEEWEADEYRAYTILPISLQDECTYDPITKVVLGKISTTKAHHADTQNEYIVFYGQEDIGQYIDIKKYVAHEGQNGTYYEEATKDTDKIDAIGIALIRDEYNNIDIDDSIEAVKNGIFVGYNGLSATNTVERKSEKIAVNVNEEKITGIVRVDTPTGEERYRYDENTVATIKAKEDKLLLRNDPLTSQEVRCALDYVLETPSGSPDGSEVTFVERQNQRGVFDIKFYPTQAGTYYIIPKATGTKVEDSLVVGLDGEETKIPVEIKKNLAVSEIEIDGVKVTNDSVPITVMADKTREQSIKFYHIYYDKQNKPQPPEEITDLTGTNLRLTLNTNDANIQYASLRDKDNDAAAYTPDGKLRQHCPKIRVTGKARGTTTLTISITNDLKYYKAGETNNQFTQTINVMVENEARTTDINVDSSITLYNYKPTLNKEITDGKNKYEYYVNGKTVVEVDGDYAYTIIPISLKDECTYDPITKIIYNKLSTLKGDHSDPTTGKVVLYGQYDPQDEIDYDLMDDLEMYIAYKGYKAYDTENGTYYVEASGSNTIDAIGIALRPKEELVNPLEAIAAVKNGIYVGYNGLNGTNVVRKQKKVEVHIEEDPQVAMFSLARLDDEEVQSIAIKEAPIATYVGDELDYEKAKLEVTMANGETKEVAITEDMITGYDKTSLKEQEIVVTYNGKLAVFTITLLPKDEMTNAIDDTNSNTIGNTIDNNVIDNTIADQTYTNTIDNNIVSDSTMENDVSNNVVDMQTQQVGENTISNNVL